MFAIFGYSLAQCAELMGEDLPCYSNKIEPLTHTHTHTFNGPLSGTTQVSQYQKGKTNLVLLKQETVSGSGISWAI